MFATLWKIIHVMFATLWKRACALATGNYVYLPSTSIVFPDQEELVITREPCAALPASLAYLTGLCVLTIRNCDMLTRLPDSLDRMASLRELYIIDCPALAQLPETLGRLTRLTALYFQRCGLTVLPESLGQLSTLTSLVMWECDQFMSFPNSICQLGGLERLRIGFCVSLVELPECAPLCLEILGHPQARMRVPSLLFSRLRTLRVSRSGDALAGVSLAGVSSLKSLACSHELVSAHLPASLERLQLWDGVTMMARLPNLPIQLTHLCISHCAILTELPESLGKLAALQRLILLHCDALLQLPESLGQLAELRHLGVGCNRLTCLPDSIGRLSKLAILELSDCARLRYLPASFGQLTTLKFLDARNTPFQ